MNLPDPIFSNRRTILEDVRAEALAVVERALIHSEMAAEFRLIDFLAEGFAELDRRWKQMPFVEKVEVLASTAKDTPEQYGAAMGPYFLEVLKQVAQRRALQPLAELAG